jgi:hypothetical protein
VPRFVPSTWNWTLAIPTLDAALAETVTVPVRVPPFAGEVMETVGGWLASVGVVTLAFEDGSEIFPAAS